MLDTLVHQAQVTFALGVGIWVVSKLLLIVAKLLPSPPPKPKSATQRFIERDWGKHGVYNPMAHTDWNELGRDLEETLKARE